MIAGLSDRRIDELDDSPLRKRISEIDEEVTSGAREKSKPQDRGMSVLQLTILVEKERSLAIEAARAAFAKWWKSPKDLNQASVASTLIAELCGHQVDLEALKSRVSEARREGRFQRGGVSATAAWVFAHELQLV
jgi:hypothetical protein